MILDCFLDIKVEDNIFFRVYLFASYKKIIILLSGGGGPNIVYVLQYIYNYWLEFSFNLVKSQWNVSSEKIF